MWRFMLITFGFLGFAFYELSGGSDYEPHENSLQAAANRNAPVSVAELAPVAAPSIEELAKSIVETAPQPQLGITLASITVDDTDQIKHKTARVTPDQVTQPELTYENAASSDQNEGRKVWPGAIELFTVQQYKRDAQLQANADIREATEAQTAQSTLTYTSDIRYVIGNVVNMRGGPGTQYGTIGQLKEGMQVAVLENADNGWLMLRVSETGQEGWTADWLVSAAVN